MVNNPIYQRAMFAGAPQAAPQTGVGTGIASGLVDQPMPMPQGSPIDQQEGELGMMAMTGLESAASGLQEMFSEIDEAEDIESMINTVRGDQKSMKQRYAELADLVGNEDAEQTPESVLAILQPTFQIMETLQGDMPQGGLASLFGDDEAEPEVQGEVVEETLQMRGSMQAPGMEEAIMRMMGGEEPVRRQFGTPRFGENFGFQNPMMSPVPVDPNSFQAIMQRRQDEMNPVLPMSPVLSEQYSALPQLDMTQFDYLQGVAPPDSRMVDPAVAGQYMQEYQQFLNPYLPQKRSAEDLQEQYSEMLDPFLRKPKTREQLLAEAEQFFGADDAKNRDIQAALALAQAGGVIANTPGSLLQALTAGGSKLAGDISVIERDKAAQDRALKQFAFQEGQRQQDELNSQNLAIAQQAITASEGDLNNFNTAMRQLAGQAFEAGLRTDTANTKQFNDTNFAAWSANNQFAGLAPVSMYAIGEDGKAEVFTAQRSADGLRKVTPEGLQALPKDAKILDATSIKTLTGAGALDFTDAQKTDLLIPDTTSDIGYQQAAGFFLNGNFFVSPTGNLRDAQIAPEGFLVGTERDAVEITRPDSVGRVYMIPKMGPNQGRRILTRSGTDGVNTGGLAYYLTPPKYETDDQGNQKLVQGNPLVETIPDIGVRYEDLTPQQVENFNRRITANIAALTEGQEVLNLLGDAVGPYNSLKQFAMNNVGSILPESAQGFVDFSRTPRGRDVMNRFSRAVVAANALSDRYAVAEQEIIKQLNVDPAVVFQNPDVAMIQFQELMRVMYNDLSHARGVIGNESIQFLPSIPVGNEADPYPYSNRFVDYVDMLEDGGVLPDETYFQMSVGQAKRAGAPASLYRGMRDTDLIKVQYSNGGFK